MSGTSECRSFLNCSSTFFRSSPIRAITASTNNLPGLMRSYYRTFSSFVKAFLESLLHIPFTHLFKGGQGGYAAGRLSSLFDVNVESIIYALIMTRSILNRVSARRE